MKMRRAMIALLAFVLSAGLADAAYASCDSNERTSHDNAECLHGWWDNNTWPTKSTFGAQNLCPDWGTVVAKVDIRSATDRTWHLSNGNKRRGDTSFTVRDISCCEDLSDLCDKEDVVTVASCKSEFEKSSANNDCIHDNEPTTNEEFCRFDLKCTYTDDEGEDYYHNTIYGVSWHTVENIVFCTEHVGIRPRLWMSNTGSC